MKTFFTCIFLIAFSIGIQAQGKYDLKKKFSQKSQLEVLKSASQTKDVSIQADSLYLYSDSNQILTKYYSKYDANGNEIYSEEQYWSDSDNSWFGEKEETTYNEVGKEIVRISSSFYNNVWVYESKWVTIYDQQANISNIILYNFDSSTMEWDIDDESIYENTYNPTGQLESYTITLRTHMGETSSEVLYRMYRLTYTAKGLLQTLTSYIYPDDVNPVVHTKKEYKYDAQGNCTEKEYFRSDDNMAWIIFDKELNFFNNENKIIAQEYYISEDGETLFGVERVVMTYENDKLRRVEFFEWDETTNNWSTIFSQYMILFYGDTVLGIESKQASNLKIWTDGAQIKVDGEIQIASIELYSAQGQLVYRNSNMQDHTSIPNVTKGIYIAKVTEVAGNVHTTKLVIK